MSTNTTATNTTMSFETFRSLKCGSTVKIVDKRPNSHVRCGWSPEMDVFLGRVATVVELANSAHLGPIVKLDIDAKHFNWTEGMLMEPVQVVNAPKNVSFVKEINKVIYNNPATIVIWTDGTKTTAKAADGEVYDPEKGLFLCALKHYVKSDAIIRTLLPFVTEQALTKKSCVTVTYKDALNSISRSTRSAKKSVK